MDAREERTALQKKWQARWDADKVRLVDTHDPSARGTYLLVMLPYPSGDRLHVGHARTLLPDGRAPPVPPPEGREGLLPDGVTPSASPRRTSRSRGASRPRVDALEHRGDEGAVRGVGVLYDWAKEVTTQEPEYYRWNQWFFLRMLERGLAYRKKGTELVPLLPDGPRERAGLRGHLRAARAPRGAARARSSGS